MLKELSRRETGGGIVHYIDEIRLKMLYKLKVL